ncbi:MAG TPA: hypothetical protein P5514_11350 [Bacteroidales bacterium]|nr:hypothetical protein [Bacteroidales bacterium]HRX97533.1 hypothetical protein [Bacteroidales bacterium]
MKAALSNILKEKNIQSLSTNVFTAAINLATFLFLVRSLGQESFGLWVIFTTAGTLAALIRFGVTRRAIIHFASGSDEEIFKKISGSGLLLDLIIMAIAALLSFAVYLIGGQSLGMYFLFFKYYPLVAIVCLLWNSALTIQSAKQRFDRILLLRLIIATPFFIFVFLNLILFHYGLETVIHAYIASHGIASIIMLLLGWTSLSDLFNSRKTEINKILNYGKYTVLTSTGSSLLRSADALMIGMSPVLGASGVALYAIPFKLVDLISIPLNAFVATASPKMSKAYISGQIQNFKRILFTYTGAVSFLFVPVVIGSAIFSRPLLTFLAGTGYENEFATMTGILYTILIYGLILPFDRFTGIALDSSEMPNINALKVYVMLSLNIAGNAIAIFVYNSLVMVAAVSVLFTVAGMWIGWYYLKKSFSLNPMGIYYEGISFYKKLFISIRSFNISH